MWVAAAAPQTGEAYVIIGRRTCLYRMTLFSRESGEFLPTREIANFLRANGPGQSDRRKGERLSHRPTDFVCHRSSRIVSAHLFKSFKFNLSNPINSALNFKILMRRYVPLLGT
ncbi:hypothetical protein TNCV_4086471, partial [Trichonephila clavipes]